MIPGSDPDTTVVISNNEILQCQPVNLQQGKANKTKFNHHVKPEKKSKEPGKNQVSPGAEFFALCVLAVGALGAAALFIALYDFVLIEGAAGTGFLLAGAAIAGILFILIFIRLIKLGKKLGKKPKEKVSMKQRNSVEATM